MTHRRHPTLARPVSPHQVAAELAAIWSRGRRGRPPRLVATEALSRTHGKTSRRYAETDGRTIFVAPEILLLSKANRVGVLAHEAGHAALIRDGWRDHTEADADRAAADLFGVGVRYDRRWPKPGLQRGRIRR